MKPHSFLSGTTGILLLVFLSGCAKQEPVASFTSDKSTVSIGETVQFTDRSINNPTSWDWTFEGGDPASSGDQNPRVTYSAAGKYKVTLQVSNSDGSDAIVRENAITVNVGLDPPEADFMASRTTLEAGESVSFTDLSSNSPTAWSWIFNGGDPLESTLQNPTVTYNLPGVYGVSLEVTNASGSDTEIKNNFITVTSGSGGGTNLTFVNTTHTDIYIEIETDDRTIPVGGSTTYTDLQGNSVDYYAETSGETAQGSQIGKLLVWDNTVALTPPSLSLDLVIPGDFYFIYMTNSGTDGLGPLEIGIINIINGFTADFTEDVVVPNDQITYPVGYYESYQATELNWIHIRAYFQSLPSSYVYWNQGTQFELPDTTNQAIYLSNTNKKNTSTASWNSANRQNRPLYPDYSINMNEQ